MDARSAGRQLTDPFIRLISTCIEIGCDTPGDTFLPGSLQRSCEPFWPRWPACGVDNRVGPGRSCRSSSQPNRMSYLQLTPDERSGRAERWTRRKARTQARTSRTQWVAHVRGAWLSETLPLSVFVIVGLFRERAPEERNRMR